jgi:NAD(P)-dependent dehydrogenase (short-subunit alcohol dehydrogenase family)
MHSNQPPLNLLRAAIVGASGGIGAALANALDSDPRYGTVLRLSRSGGAIAIDLEDEASIATAAARCGSDLNLLIVATGALQVGPQTPEKSSRALDGTLLARSFAINAIGPALVAKHFLPLLPRQGPAVFAALSARVGSIGDNRLGGWYGYRAAKAALNQLIRTLSIELAVKRPQAICVGLHPGTVDTALSAPFQTGVPKDKLLTPDFCATSLLAVLHGLTPSDSGSVFDWQGARLPD